MFDTPVLPPPSEEAAVYALLEQVEAQEAALFAARSRLLSQAQRLGDAAGRGEFVPGEVAATCRISENSARGRLASAAQLEDLPATAEALAAGRLGVPHALGLLEVVAPLPVEQARAVEDAVLARAADRTPAQIRRLARREVLRIDPDAAARRRRDAVADRRVVTGADVDGMGTLWALLPAEALARFRIGLDELCDRERAADPDDPRTADQLRADILADLPDRVLSHVGRADGATAEPENPAASRQTRRARRRRTQVQVQVPVAVALGLSDAPAELAGHGPIDAAHARVLLTDAELRKVCVDQDTGEVVAVGDRVVRPEDPEGLRQALLDMIRTPAVVDDRPEADYRPSAGLTRFIQARDVTCTFPGCSVPAHRCDLDHTTSWPAGSTHPDNMSALSRRHHRAKHAGWRSRRQAGGTDWTSPCGRHYHRPPPHHSPPRLKRRGDREGAGEGEGEDSEPPS